MPVHRTQRTHLSLFCVPLVLALLVLAPAPTARALGEARVVEDWNLRAGPGLNYAILAVMPAGGTVALTGPVADGWYAVVFADAPGWVYGEGLVLDERAFAPEATVVAASLNVRAAPGLDAGILTLLDEGARVTLVGDPVEADGHSWVPIEGAAAIAGWVAAEYLSADEVP
jgi:uncharacterized protein YraI